MADPFYQKPRETHVWLSNTEAKRGSEVRRANQHQRVTLVDMTGLEFEPAASCQVLIIEDEPFIALDLVEVVESLDHDVIAVARTLKDALAICQNSNPGLVISDIQLSDGSSGIDAVNEILKCQNVPVIFISAFLDELTSANRPTPLITISKPFRPAFVREAINQAIAFKLEAQPAAEQVI